MIQRSHPLVVFGRILLRHHTVPPLLDYAFREWRENQHLSTPTFSRVQHAILHWKKAISRSFALIAQAWVRMSQWPSFMLIAQSGQAWVQMSQLPSFNWKSHQSRMGGISLKIEERRFIGPRDFWRSIFLPLQWRERMVYMTRRWTSIL